MTAKELLLKKFKSAAYATKSDLGFAKGKWPRDREEALRECEAEGAIVKVGARYYLHPTVEKESSRIELILKGKKRLFTESALKSKGQPPPPFFRQALDELVDDRAILRLEVEGAANVGFVYVHVAHLRTEGSEKRPPVHQESPAKKAVASDPEAQILAAYRELSELSGSRSVFISDLLRRSGLSLEEMHHWLQNRVVAQGIGTLDEGDWASSSQENRAAAFEERGRRRLYVRLHS